MRMSRARGVLTALTALLVAVGSTATAHAQPVPAPDDDPFYAVPADLGGLPDGAVLRSRPITALSLSVPLLASAWQVLYKTRDHRDQPTATVATVLVPKSRWAGSGSRPLVSYQFAEDGAGTRCAPSYALRAGLPAGITTTNLETTLMASALSRGWAVVTSDYEGPQSLLFTARMEAHGVLDGIRAARGFAPAGISADAPVGAWGYSGGAFATASAAQLQPAYAPELRLSGIALGGVPADLGAMVKDFDGSVVGGAIPMGLAAFDRAWPEAGIRSLLTARGRADVDASASYCLLDAVARHPGWRLNGHTTVPDALDLPRSKGFLDANSPLRFAGTPSVPVYSYHSVLDELAPVAEKRKLMARYCAAGVPAQQVEQPVGEHVTEMVSGAAGALGYLGDRFAGKPAPTSCR